MLGTLLPVDDEVKKIVCAEFGDRWTVRVDGEPDKLVEVIGMDVSVEPELLTVDAITEDVVDIPPSVLKPLGIGSGSLHSGPTNYAGALSGTYVAIVGGSGSWYCGQYSPGESGGPTLYSIDEAFFWFDTSAIPVSATILEATFAGLAHPPWDPQNMSGWTDFDVQLRGYPTGGWRPTLAAADWRTSVLALLLLYHWLPRSIQSV